MRSHHSCVFHVVYDLGLGPEEGGDLSWGCPHLIAVEGTQDVESGFRLASCWLGDSREDTGRL